MTALVQSDHIHSVILPPPPPQYSLEVISPKENANPPPSFLPRMNLSTPISTSAVGCPISFKGHICQVNDGFWVVNPQPYIITRYNFNLSNREQTLRKGKTQVIHWQFYMHKGSKAVTYTPTKEFEKHMFSCC